ncbi:MAG: alkaline phosphatase [Bacteroidales bacterium]|nr:alkaline phosphatase [Bacteroidales bacterium]
MKNIIVLSLIVIVSLPLSSCTSKKPAETVEKPKNIILLIGDGMGVTQVYAGLTANRGSLNLEKCNHVGFSKTYSASDYITDSGAGGTALSTGVKTYNGAIGVNKDTISQKTILEYAEDYGLATGLISTSAITHATPASFIAHQASRNNYEAIAADFLNTDIDVFIGGGKNHFDAREDGRMLTDELKAKGYRVYFNLDSVTGGNNEKLCILTAAEHNPPQPERGDMLSKATVMALQKLSDNKKGFFIMIEGSQIDWGGHANHTEYITSEMIDFDKAIGKALDFAEKDGNTLVIITADHETGGMAITGGNFKEGRVEAGYVTTNHSGVMVPVFSYGPGAENFTGIFENTDIFNNMMKELGFDK